MNQCQATVEVIHNIERCGGLYRIMVVEIDCPAMLLYDGREWTGIQRFILGA